jgi:hypothetical protein
MNYKLNAVLNLLGMILVITINALANILPINGYNTGEVSGFYPNYFVPAGFTFGIWGIIYMLLIGFVVFSIAVSFINIDEDSRNVISAISLPFQVTCLLNAGWIIAWHYLQLGFSLFIMIGLLVFLIRIFLRLHKQKMSLKPVYSFWIHQPFIVYLGWICVATIANITALLVGIGWQGGPISPANWSVFMIVVAFGLGSYFTGKLKKYGYTLVLSWAFFGIYSNQVNVSRPVGYTALFACSALLALMVATAIKTRKVSIR